MAGVAEQNISDEKMVAATGRPRAEWHDLLDEQDATSWKHSQIARWLSDVHGVDGWWAQGITVGYEQARGMRVPGQLPDGTFSTSSSKTVPGNAQEALDLAVQAYTPVAGSAPITLNPDAKHPAARWRLTDGSTVLATIGPGSAGKSRIVLTHSKLTSSDQLAPAKARLAEVLAELASRVDRTVG